MPPKTQPRQDPRIAPKEMIVTRRKSALQKRQLREKDRSMKNITQLLKSPTKNSQSPKKQKMAPKGKINKKLLQELLPPAEVELKPVKRRPKVKERVWLKPKPNFKMVAKTNKRKLCTPRRELDPGCSQVEHVQCDSSDILQLIEDTESLDEEDFLEILTCPSPVWWEEPRDPSYCEKPIFVPTPSQATDNSTENTIDKIISNKTIKDLDQKVVKKRKKLENILGNIKSKRKFEHDAGDHKSDTLDIDLLNDEMLRNLEAIHIPIEPSHDAVELKKVKIEKENEVSIKNNSSHSDEVKLEMVPSHIAQNELDTKINEDQNVAVKKITSKSDRNELKDLKVPDILPPLQRNPMHTTSVLDKIVINSNLMSKDAEKINVKFKMDSAIERENSTVTSPFFEKSKDDDTISDTNIKFIDKVEDQELDDTSQIILDKIKKFFHEKKVNKKEYITVYRIVDKEEKQELKNDDQSKINYFYKKCKNFRKKCDNVDTSKSNSGKTLALANSNMKYCLNCSSIFETKECHYCAAMSEPRECVCDKSQDNRSDLSCDNCDRSE
ncbi:putative leucine-rich repeat-containing protein DDB_G0290503 isoform X2 [Amyelois transitella]|nr:putative leucine-rich repeat-containing protein DDB_G0290503 isoform X2 [Amyelois transitella]